VHCRGLVTAPESKGSVRSLSSPQLAPFFDVWPFMNIVMSAAARPRPVFVFVSREDGGVMKRLQRPINLTVLKGMIQKAFNVTLPIAAIRTRTGVPVGDIRDIAAGAKVTVVFREGASSRASSAFESSDRAPRLAAVQVDALSDFSYEESEEESESQREEESEDESEEEGEEESEEEKALIQPVESYIIEGEPIGLMEAVFPDEEFKDDVLMALEIQAAADRERLSKLLRIEDAQKVRYVKEALRQMRGGGAFRAKEDLSGGETIAAAARAFVVSHMIATAVPVCHTMRAVVSGPRRSGKTAFLGIIAEELLLSLIASDSWRHTFVFVADMSRVFSDSQHDLVAFYTGFVRHVFALLRAQLPAMLRYLPEIEAAFLDVAAVAQRPRSISLPKRMLQDHEFRTLCAGLNGIGDALIESRFDPTALSEWLAIVLQLPTSLARAFGFGQTIWLLDNFDACSAMIEPVHRFDDAPRRRSRAST